MLLKCCPGTCLFRIMLLIHRAVNCLGPVYLCDLIGLYTPTRSLRSAGTKQLNNKRPKTKCKAGDASFPAAAPYLWNRLPFPVRELYNEDAFKSRPFCVSKRRLKQVKFLINISKQTTHIILNSRQVSCFYHILHSHCSIQNYAAPLQRYASDHEDAAE